MLFFVLAVELFGFFDCGDVDLYSVVFGWGLFSLGWVCLGSVAEAVEDPAGCEQEECGW